MKVEYTEAEQKQIIEKAVLAATSKVYADVSKAVTQIDIEAVASCSIDSDRVTEEIKKRVEEKVCDAIEKVRFESLLSREMQTVILARMSRLDSSALEQILLNQSDMRRCIQAVCDWMAEARADLTQLREDIAVAKASLIVRVPESEVSSSGK